MKTYLVISALGQERSGLLDQLSRSVLDCGCNIRNSRVTVLGTELAAIVLVEGNWNNVAKLETVLPGLEKRTNLSITTRRTEKRKHERKLLPYGVEVVALDQPGIVHNLASFFSTRDIAVADMVTDAYTSNTTGTPMFSVHMTVDVPADLQIAALREEFMDLCDRLNLDAVLEPVKA